MSWTNWICGRTAGPLPSGPVANHRFVPRLKRLAHVLRAEAQPFGRNPICPTHFQFVQLPCNTGMPCASRGNPMSVRSPFRRAVSLSHCTGTKPFRLKSSWRKCRLHRPHPSSLPIRSLPCCVAALLAARRSTNELHAGHWKISFLPASSAVLLPSAFPVPACLWAPGRHRYPRRSMF